MMILMILCNIDNDSIENACYNNIVKDDDTTDVTKVVFLAQFSSLQLFGSRVVDVLGHYCDICFWC